ncbi:hypothetical protein HOH87_06270 [bacterium]|jgi:LemA protein|nr:hypothetical protein [bacterium]
MIRDETQKRILWGIVGVLLIGFLWGQSLRNRVIVLRESVATSWTLVEIQMQRRMALIPSEYGAAGLVTKHDSAIIEDIATSRIHYVRAKETSQRVVAANQLEVAFAKLTPKPLFKTFKSGLADVDAQLSIERSRYNQDVTLYNETIIRAPFKYAAQFEQLIPLPVFGVEVL